MTDRPLADDLAYLRAKIETNLRENDEGFHAEAAKAVTSSLRWYRPLEWTTPTNIEQVRDEVTAAIYSGTSPRIIARYDATPAPSDLEAAARDMERAVTLIRNHFAASELQRKAKEIRDLGVALASQRDEDFTRWSLQTYGVPAMDTVRAAENLCATTDSVDRSSITVDDRILAGLLQGGLDLYGLNRWRIEPASIGAKVSTEGINRLIKVQRGVLVSLEEARRLLAHEIGRHVLSMENARQQPDPFACLPFGWQQLATEEGMASWLETYLTGSPSPHRTRIFAARALAASWAQDLGVVEIVRRLTETLSVSDAVIVAIRAKRGIHELSGPGGSTKDHQYITGQLRIQQHLAVHPGDLPKIQATKWSLDQLPDIERRLATGQLRPAMFDADLLREVPMPTIGKSTTRLSGTSNRTGWLNRLRKGS